MDQKLESAMPEKWVKELDGKPLNEVSEILSTHRTTMSTHRTHLSTARSHMSNERTHLAYLRTALSMMTFGITLNRFSIFLKENRSVSHAHGILNETEFVGLGIVIIGLVLLVWALIRFKRVQDSIKEDSYISSSRAINWMTVAMILLGGFSAFWMITSRRYEG